MLFVNLGEISEIIGASFTTLIQMKLRWGVILEQFYHLAARSVFIIMVAGFAIGMVLNLQVATELQRFGVTLYIANISAVSILREFAPIFTALLVIGRAGSSITAEIGTMTITEQVQAMKMLNLDISKFIILPRILACIFATVTLTVVFNVVALLAGCYIAVNTMGLQYDDYTNRLLEAINSSNFFVGIIKAGLFGLIMGALCCYYGLRATEGSKSVSDVTRKAVLMSSVTVIVSDFFATKFLLYTFGLLVIG